MFGDPRWAKIIVQMDIPIRPNVLKMHPYLPGKPIEDVQRDLGLDHVIKLASNENPLGPSPKAIEAIRAAAGDLQLYPDAACHNLKRAISEKFGMETNQIMIGNGSDELIALLAQVLIQDSEDEILAGSPSFVRYDACANLAPCKMVHVPLDDNLKIDMQDILTAITPRTRMIYLANPNNPTGTRFEKDEFDAFISKVSSSICVILDEAYFEFSNDLEGSVDSAEYLSCYPNLVGLRTFSKAYGLAGIRLGYGWSSAELVDAVNRIRPPFNVNNLAQVGGIAALADDEHMKAGVAHNARERVRVAHFLQYMGLRVYESFANFLLVDMAQPAEPLFESLLHKGVIVRSGKGLGLPTCLRISLGTVAENDQMISALSSVIQPQVQA
jgi:histidinol-phosphate aminotransferase